MESKSSVDKCLTNHDSLKEFKNMLPVFEQTTEYTCGPAVLLSVLSSRQLLNSKITDQELGRKIGTDSLVGTSPEEMAQGLRLYGLESNIQIHKHPRDFFIKFNPQRIYLLLIMDEGDAHWVALAGYANHIIYLMDPYKNQGDLREVSLCYLLENWKNVKFDAHTVYNYLSIEIP